MRGTPPAGTVGTEELLAQRDWLIALAARLVRDQAERDDLVQETWLAALAQPGTARADLRGWLGAILRNRWRFARRSAHRRGEREAAYGPPEPSPMASELAEQAEQQVLLARAVLALPEPYRATVLMRYFGGLSSRAIARRQGLPEGTVRSRLKRGLDQLRSALDERAGQDGRAWALALVPLARLERAAVALTKIGAVAAVGLGVLFGAAWWSWAGTEPSTPFEASSTALTTPDSADPLAPAGQRDGRLPESAEAALAMLQADDGLELAVLDPLYAPIGAATIVVLGDDSSSFTADLDGRCRLPDEAWTDDRIRLRVEAEGFEHADLDLWRRDLPWRAPLPVLLSPTTLFTGRVTDAHGVALAGVEIEAYHDFCYEPIATAASDALGAFELTGLSAGHEITLRAFARGRALITRRVQIPSRASAPFSLELAEDQLLSGRVLDAWSGAPLTGARLYHTLNSHSSRPAHAARELAVSGEGGALALPISRDGEEYLVVAPGYASTLVAPRADGFELALLPLATLEGCVRSADGRPVAGLELSIRGMARETTGRSLDATLLSPAVIARLGDGELRLPEWVTITDAEGRFRIDVFPAKDDLELHLDPERVEHAPLRGGAALLPREQRAFELTLAEFGSIRGTLRIDGIPGPGVVTCTRGGSTVRTASAGGDGSFEIAGLLAGPLHLEGERMTASGSTLDSGAGLDTEVVAGESRVVELEVRAALGRIHGHVRDARGDGLPFRKVSAARPLQAGRWHTYTDREGAFELFVPRESEALRVGIDGIPPVPVVLDEAPLVLVAPSYGRVRISVTGEEGQALDRVELFERRAGQDWHALGAYSIGGDGFAEWVLESGPVELAISKVEQGYPPLVLGRQSIREDVELELRCSLERVEPVEFRLETPLEPGLGGVRIEVSDGPPFLHGIFDTGERLWLSFAPDHVIVPGLPDGTYRVVPTSPMIRVTPAEFTLGKERGPVALSWSRN